MISLYECISSFHNPPLSDSLKSNLSATITSEQVARLVQLSGRIQNPQLSCNSAAIISELEMTGNAVCKYYLLIWNTKCMIWLCIIHVKYHCYRTQWRWCSCWGLTTLTCWITCRRFSKRQMWSSSSLASLQYSSSRKVCVLCPYLYAASETTAPIKWCNQSRCPKTNLSPSRSSYPALCCLPLQMQSFQCCWWTMSWRFSSGRFMHRWRKPDGCSEWFSLHPRRLLTHDKLRDVHSVGCTRHLHSCTVRTNSVLCWF